MKRKDHKKYAEETDNSLYFSYQNSYYLEIVNCKFNANVYKIFTGTSTKWKTDLKSCLDNQM